MKKISLVFTMLVLIATVNAQQLQTSSLYDLQGMFHNPAMAGMTEKGLIGVTYRTQWSSISGSPKTATVFGSIALPQHNIGLGAYIYNDKTGPTSRTGIAVSFAKHIPLANDAVLGSGSNKFKFDAGFGIAYAGKKLEIGASVSQLVQSKLGYYAGNLT